MICNIILEIDDFWLQMIGRKILEGEDGF